MIFNPNIHLSNAAKLSRIWGPPLYTYDEAGNVTAMGVDNFRYDTLSRLVDASVSSRNSGQQFHMNYSYDNFGNLTDRVWVNPPPNFSLDTGGFFDLVTIDDRKYDLQNRVKPESGQTNNGFIYDRNGNLTQDLKYQYFYDELSRLIATKTVDGELLSQYVYDTDNERALKAVYSPGILDPISSSVYFRDETGRVQFESTRVQEINDEDPSSPISVQKHRAYGYALGEIAYQLDYEDGLRPSNYDAVTANNLNSDCIVLPGLNNPQFITRPNGYDVMVPLDVPCIGDDIKGITLVLYQSKAEDQGNGAERAWEEREKWSVALGNEEPLPEFVVWPHLLYDREYRTVMEVETTANSFGWNGNDLLVSGETTWNVPKDERKSYVAAVRDGRDGRMTLWWDPAADLYNVYRNTGSGERVLLNGSPLNEPGLSFSSVRALELGFTPLDLYEIEGINPDGANGLGGVSSPGFPNGPGGPGGGNQRCVIVPPFCEFNDPNCRDIFECTNLNRSPIKVTYFHTDHLGTPRALTDKNGVVVSRHDFEPYGIELPGGIVATSNKKFTGHERDPETNLTYMHMRYYSVESAFFTAPDQASPNQGFAASFNKYSYGLNNPMIYNDPFGMYPNMTLMGNMLTQLFQSQQTLAQVSGPLPAFFNAQSTPIFDRNGNVWSGEFNLIYTGFSSEEEAAIAAGDMVAQLTNATGWEWASFIIKINGGNQWAFTDPLTEQARTSSPFGDMTSRSSLPGGTVYLPGQSLDATNSTVTAHVHSHTSLEVFSLPDEGASHYGLTLYSTRGAPPSPLGKNGQPIKPQDNGIGAMRGVNKDFRIFYWVRAPQGKWPKSGMSILNKSNWTGDGTDLIDLRFRNRMQ